MAGAGLFLCGGSPSPGRERKGFDFFTETLNYLQRLQDDGRIESFETVLLDAHDMRGFFLCPCHGGQAHQGF